MPKLISAIWQILQFIVQIKINTCKACPEGISINDASWYNWSIYQATNVISEILSIVWTVGPSFSLCAGRFIALPVVTEVADKR